MKDPDAGSGRIGCAVFVCGMKRGADDFACSAAIALVNIDPDRFDGFLHP
jgi:hypothetical protein